MKKTDTSLKKRLHKLFWLIPVFLMTFSFQLHAQEQVLIDEELRDGNLPANWSQVDIDFRTAAGGYALFETSSSVLQTPVFDLSEFDSVTLTFDVAKFGGGGDGPLTVQVSDDGGDTWTGQEFNSEIPTDATYLTSEHSITVSGENVSIRWVRTESPSGKRLRDVTLVGFMEGEPSPIEAFNLLSPPNNARVAVYEGDTSEIVIDWEDADGADFYQWVANIPGEGFDDPALALNSDNGGTESTLTITSGEVYQALAALGVAEGSSVQLEWTVIAETTDFLRQANQVWNVNFAAPVLVSSIGEFRSGDADVIYAIDTEVVYLGGDNFRNRKFLDDGELGILVDDQPGRVTTEYEVGDGITRAVGTYVAFSGQAQLSAWADFGPATSFGNPVDPIELSLEEMLADFETYQSRLLKVNNVVFTEDGDFVNGTNYTLQDADDSSVEGVFRSEFFNRDYIGEPIPQDAQNITGFGLTRQTDINYIVARSSDDFETADEDETITTIAELRQQVGQGEVTFTGEAILTFQQSFRNQRFIQDETGGIMIDDNSGIITTEYEVGDAITNIKGTVSVFGNMVQFVPAQDPGAPVSSGNEVEPLEISLSELNNDFDLYQSRLVTVTNIAFTDPSGTFANGQVYGIEDTNVSGVSGEFRTTFFNVDYIGESIPGAPQNITGLPNSRSEGDFLTARSQADFSDFGPDDQVATPSFDPGPGNFTGEVTVSISTATEGATIYFTTDGTDPDTDSEVYTEPLTFTETTTLSAFAVLEGLDDSEIFSGEYVISDEVTISTIAELRAQEGQGEVTFTGEAILTFQQSFRNQKFIQDETGGIMIDDNPGIITTDYEVGDAITNITGSVSVFGNMVQFVPAVDPGEPVSSGNEVEPLEITLDELYSDFNEYQSRLVKVIGVVFPEAEGNFANGQVYPIEDINDPSIEGEFRTTFFGVDYIGTSIPTAPQNITGLPNSRAEGDFLTARNQADFQTFASDDQVAAPVIEPGSGLYTEPVEVTMSVEDDQATITYTLDGSEPGEGSTPYTGPFTVDETTTVQARAFRAGFEPSAVVSATYNFPVEVENLAEARELELGTAVRVTGLITTPDFGFNNAEFYMQDEVGGIKVRWAGFGGGNDPDTPFAEGQEVELVGTLDTRFEELLVAPVEFDILSEGNVLPEATPIDDYDELWTVDSPEQGRRVTIFEVSLVDPSQWPVDPISAGSGVTVQAEDADGNVYDIRIDRDESFFDGSPLPPPVFNLSGVLGQFEDNAQMFPFYEFELEEVLEDPVVQVIHNSADPAFAEVDVYIDGFLVLDGVAFRTATETLSLPGDTPFTISITGAGDDLENAVYEAEVTLAKGENYYIIAGGVSDESAFEPNPDGISTAFDLDIIEGAVFESAEPSNVEFAIYHGVTDAPAVDVVARDLATLASGLAYTDISENYISVPADAYVLDIFASGTGDLVATFNADLSTLQGQIGLALASGFLNPEQGEAFAILVVLADGSIVVLDPETSLGNDGEIPTEFALKQNFPNPFNPTTQITYALPENVHVQVDVFNVTGQRVATLVNGQQSAGVHTVTFDASRLSTGVYLYRIQAGSYSEVRKMMLVK